MEIDRETVEKFRSAETTGAILSLSFGLLLVTGRLGGGLAMAHLRAGAAPLPN
jgi:hypothetical protein